MPAVIVLVMVIVLAIARARAIAIATAIVIVILIVTVRIKIILNGSRMEIVTKTRKPYISLKTLGSLPPRTSPS